MTADAVALAESLAAINPSWGTRVAGVGDWWAVLCGPGFYVNRLEGGGLDDQLTSDHLREFETLAQDVGVVPAVTVADVGHPGTKDLLTECGYQRDGTVTIGVAALDASGDERRALVGADFVLEAVVDDEGLGLWQSGAATGWGHTTSSGRHTSDEFARAAMRAAGSTLFLVREAQDGRVVATCLLAIRDGIATLGGMSVLPNERRRGIQSASIALRLTAARRAGCDLVATSTVAGGDSERNVRRHGFALSHAVTTWSKTSSSKT